VRFGCEGLVVFWGGCVVFWCSFWVGFWLSESLRGVFTPARNGRLQSPSPASRERGTKGVRAKRRAHPFTPTRGKSPLPQRFCAEPMYPYQGEGREWGDSARAGICELRLGDWYYTNCAVRIYNCPPSCRFSPLREGNRARVRFPLLAGGTLRRGSSTAVFFDNFGFAIGIRPQATHSAHARR
jgi:hypothetical protein